LNAIAEVGVFQAGFRDEVYRPAEQCLQAFLERRVRVRVLRGRKIVELDREIEVAGRGVEVGPNGGAEDVQPSTSTGACCHI